MVVVASATTLDDLPPALLAAAGATVLTHNELVRLNYTRRRSALVDPDVFQVSAIALTAAGVLAVLGVAVADAFAGGFDPVVGLDAGGHRGPAGHRLRAVVAATRGGAIGQP